MSDTMELPTWQERAPNERGSTSAPERVPFSRTKKLFAVDASGSTMGTIMGAEKDCVLGLQSTDRDVVCKWGTNCEIPQTVTSVATGYFYGSSGTEPDCIFNQPAAVHDIKDSDLWVLLTDGEIHDRDVEQLTRSAEQAGVTQVPVILLIVGGRYSTPDQENISVGVSFFASARDALILYKSIHDGHLYVIDAKGVFQGLGDETRDLSDWSKLLNFASEKDFKEALTSLDFDPGRSQRWVRGVSLGPEWDTATGDILVKVDGLLEQNQLGREDLRNLLQEEAITQLALTCKIRRRLNDLRSLVLRHKQQEVVVRLEDRHEAGQIMEEIQALSANEQSERARLSEELRRAHSANRETYQRLRDSPSEETKTIIEFNRLIDRALRIISEYEKSSYTADILSRKSNRAKRAEKVSSADTEVQLAALDLSSEVGAYRGYCPICCGEEEIMSIALKKLDSVEDNTTDFALNFPLAAARSKQNANIVSSQSICFQCSLLLERSIYQEDISAKLPTVDFSGPNKTFIINQLYGALTAGLRTGASPLVQLFAAILDDTLETKSWCAQGNVDEETVSRRKTFTWVLHNFLNNVQCREDFNENGRWVKYPQALEWAANEFRGSAHQTNPQASGSAADELQDDSLEATFDSTQVSHALPVASGSAPAGLDSWIIQYPPAGFTQLMRWYEILDLPVDEELLAAIRHAKLIHLVITKIMDHLLKSGYEDGEWAFPFLRLIYRDFNAPGVPKDLGQSSLIKSNKFWDALTVALGGDQWSDIRNFLGLFQSNRHAYPKKRVQMVTYWALYTRKNHSKPKTFFANLKLRAPLAITVLDTTSKFPKKAVKEALLSIFCPTRRTDEAFVLHDSGGITPFVSPYGPSVLQCGQPGCGVKFYEQKDIEKDDLQLTIREGRKKHLSEVFAVKDTNFTSQTGLPENTTAPKPPSAHHNTLHVSTARTWANLNHQERRQVIDAVDNEDSSDSNLKRFVVDVQHQLCATSHKGDIYSPTIEAEIFAVLPSFITALRLASRKEDLPDQSGCAFEHDWKQNTIVWKMEYELSL